MSAVLPSRWNPVRSASPRRQSRCGQQGRRDRRSVAVANRSTIASSAAGSSAFITCTSANARLSSRHSAGGSPSEGRRPSGTRWWFPEASTPEEVESDPVIAYMGRLSRGIGPAVVEPGDEVRDIHADPVVIGAGLPALDEPQHVLVSVRFQQSAGVMALGEGRQPTNCRFSWAFQCAFRRLGVMHQELPGGPRRLRG